MGKGALTVVEPPQELVNVKIPLSGGFRTVKSPDSVYVFVVGSHVVGVAESAVILQSISQFVEAVDPEVELNVISPRTFSKLVNSIM